jgi:hypothetical protein
MHWSFLLIVGVTILALLINSYLGLSRWLVPAGSTNVL